MTLRRLLFWLHLAVGLAIAICIGSLALTGSLIAFEPQLIATAERSLRTPAPSVGTACSPPSALLGAAARATSLPLTSLTLFTDPTRPAQIATGTAGAVLLADPCTGRILGPGASRLRVFLTAVRELHHAAAFQGVRHEPLRALKNAAALFFLFMILSGLVLWFPRKRTWEALRPSVLFRRGLHGRAREWNLHNLAGFWLCLPLLVIVTTGIIMAYPWANALLYRAAGEAPPSPRKPAPPAQPQAASVQNASHIQNASHLQNTPDLQDPASLAANRLTYLDLPIARALSYAPTTVIVALRLPDHPPRSLTFQLSRDLRGQTMNRDQLTLATADSSVLRFEPFAGLSRARRWRINARYLHSGELFGLPGQAIAFLSTLSTLLLVWTGISLSLHRLAAWRRRRSRHQASATSPPQPHRSVRVG